MKITITNEVKTSIEISLPRFTTDGNNTYYAILGEDEMITAYYNGKRAAIDTFLYRIEEKAVLTQITQKEFEAAYVKASDFLADQFETMRDKIEEKKNEIFDKAA